MVSWECGGSAGPGREADIWPLAGAGAGICPQLSIWGRMDIPKRGGNSAFTAELESRFYSGFYSVSKRRGRSWVIPGNV